MNVASAETAPTRMRLARWIVRHWNEEDLAVDEDAIAGLVRVAHAEGVSALVDAGLALCPQAPALLRAAFARSARMAIMAAMLQQAECQRVLGKMGEHGVPVLLLKGAALAHWLYPAPYLRDCSDIDLMADGRAGVRQAFAAVEGLGYAAVYQADRFNHALLCAKPLAGGGKVEIDLHVRLANAPMYANVFRFAELHAAAIPIPRLGPNAFGLSPAHALLHACVHRVSNIVTGIGDRLKWLYEIHLLCARLAENDWEEVLGIAVERGLCGVTVAAIECAAGYFCTSAPVAWLDRLGAGADDETLDVSRLADWPYMQRQNLMALPSAWMQLRWLWGRAFPPLQYLRAIYGAPLGRRAALGLRMRRLTQRLQ